MVAKRVAPARRQCLACRSPKRVAMGHPRASRASGGTPRWKSVRKMYQARMCEFQGPFRDRPFAVRGRRFKSQNVKIADVTPSFDCRLPRSMPSPTFWLRALGLWHVPERARQGRSAGYAVAPPVDCPRCDRTGTVELMGERLLTDGRRPCRCLKGTRPFP